MSDDTPAESGRETEAVSFVEFLEATPPGALVAVTGLCYRNSHAGRVLNMPDVQLHCGSATCGGPRFFANQEFQAIPFSSGSRQIFFDYVCRNCRTTIKSYALWVSVEGASLDGEARKYGEWPPFGPPTPSRVISLIGPDRDAFLKGRRSENQGLGIGAFAYYRRVVENQKDRLLDEIIRVAQRTRAAPELIARLEAAKQETQFSKAIDSVRDAVPETLRVEGHNPLTLLHSALSEGLHAKSDEECLELATSIRVILQELAERSAAALKDHAELTSALARLNRRT